MLKKRPAHFLKSAILWLFIVSQSTGPVNKMPSLSTTNIKKGKKARNMAMLKAVHSALSAKEQEKTKIFAKEKPKFFT